MIELMLLMPSFLISYKLLSLMIELMLLLPRISRVFAVIFNDCVTGVVVDVVFNGR